MNLSSILITISMITFITIPIVIMRKRHPDSNSFYILAIVARFLSCVDALYVTYILWNIAICSSIGYLVADGVDAIGGLACTFATIFMYILSAILESKADVVEMKVGE